MTHLFSLCNHTQKPQQHTYAHAARPAKFHEITDKQLLRSKNQLHLNKRVTRRFYRFSCHWHKPCSICKHLQWQPQRALHCVSLAFIEVGRQVTRCSCHTSGHWHRPLPACKTSQNSTRATTSSFCEANGSPKSTSLH